MSFNDIKINQVDTFNYFSNFSTNFGNNTLTAVYVYMFVYFFNLGLICLLLSETYFITNNISRLIKFSCNDKKLSFILLVSACSLAGIPPFAGFFSKLFICYIILKKYNLFICFIFLFILFLSFFFYLQLIKFARKNMQLTKSDLKSYKLSTKLLNNKNCYSFDFLIVFFFFIHHIFFFFY